LVQQSQRRAIIPVKKDLTQDSNKESTFGPVRKRNHRSVLDERTNASGNVRD
jgi:hypothetical protein